MVPERLSTTGSQPAARVCEDLPPPQDWLCRAAFLAAPLLHAGALFSNSFILAEGRALGFGLATMTALLTRSALLAAPQPQPQQQQQQQQRAGRDAAAGIDAAPVNGLNAASADAAVEADEQQDDNSCKLTVAGEAHKAGGRVLLATGVTVSTSAKASSSPAAGVSSGFSERDGSPSAGQPPTAAQAEDARSGSSFPAAAGQLPAAAPAPKMRGGVSVLAAGVAALMLLFALGQRGLVVRSGHDAMWRTAAEHRTVLPTDDTVPADILCHEQPP